MSYELKNIYEHLSWHITAVEPSRCRKKRFHSRWGHYAPNSKLYLSPAVLRGTRQPHHNCSPLQNLTKNTALWRLPQLSMTSGESTYFLVVRWCSNGWCYLSYNSPERQVFANIESSIHRSWDVQVWRQLGLVKTFWTYFYDQLVIEHFKAGECLIDFIAGKVKYLKRRAHEMRSAV